MVRYRNQTLWTVHFIDDLWWKILPWWWNNYSISADIHVFNPPRVKLTTTNPRRGHAHVSHHPVHKRFLTPWWSLQFSQRDPMISVISGYSILWECSQFAYDTYRWPNPFYMSLAKERKRHSILFSDTIQNVFRQLGKFRVPQRPRIPLSTFATHGRLYCLLGALHRSRSHPYQIRHWRIYREWPRGLCDQTGLQWEEFGWPLCGGWRSCHRRLCTVY